MTEYTFRSEADAHAARRRMIDHGATVSLIAYDAARDVYAFDSEGEA